MMWSPVLNNIVTIAVFGGYLLATGHSTARAGTYTPAQVAWFGLGSTVGIAVQALVLLPVLHRTGLHLRVRRDLRGVGLAKAARLGSWTVLFVVVNQVTYVVLTRLATGAIAARPDQAAGLSVFNGAILIGQLPHAVITVSLATALLPAMSRAAADTDLERVRADLLATIRQALALVLPAAVLLVPLAVPVAGLVFGYGAAAQDVDQVSVALVTMAPGMVFFAVQFLNLRGFYALEDTRTPFLVQLLAVSPVYITVGWLLVPRVAFPPAALTAAYSCAYLVATVVSSVLLGRRLGGPTTSSLGGFFARVLGAAVPAALLAWGIDRLTEDAVETALGPGLLHWLGLCLLAGIPAVLGYVAAGPAARRRRDHRDRSRRCAADSPAPHGRGGRRPAAARLTGPARSAALAWARARRRACRTAAREGRERHRRRGHGLRAPLPARRAAARPRRSRDVAGPGHRPRAGRRGLRPPASVTSAASGSPTPPVRRPPSTTRASCACWTRRSTATASTSSGSGSADATWHPCWRTARSRPRAPGSSPARWPRPSRQRTPSACATCGSTRRR